MRARSSDESVDGVGQPASGSSDCQAWSPLAELVGAHRGRQQLTAEHAGTAEGRPVRRPNGKSIPVE